MASNTHTLLDVVNIVGFRCGDIKDRFTALVSEPATENIIYCVNAAFRQMCRVKGLRMKGARTVINTLLPYSTGTVTFTNGSTTVLGSGTTFTSAMAGRAIMGDIDLTEYRIATFTDTTHVEMDKAWVGDTIAGAAYKIAQDRYALGAGFSDINFAALDGPSTRDLIICSPVEIDRQRYVMRSGASGTVGAPSHITIFDKDSSNNWMIQLDPIPDDEYRVVLRGQDMPNKYVITDAATAIAVDDENIDTLISGAVACWKSKDDPNIWMQWISSELPFYAALDTKMTDERPKLIPDDPTRVMNSLGRRTFPRQDSDYLLGR